MANITGDYPQIERIDTGLYSLNKALSGGWPMTTVELTGFAGVFKSTFAISILSLVAEHYGKKFLLAPIEPADREQLNSILDSILVKMGKAKYTWVTVVPAVFVLTATMYGGIQKVLPFKEGDRVHNAVSHVAVAQIQSKKIQDLEASLSTMNDQAEM